MTLSDMGGGNVGRGSAIAGINVARASPEQVVRSPSLSTAMSAPIDNYDDGRPSPDCAMATGADRHE